MDTIDFWSLVCKSNTLHCRLCCNTQYILYFSEQRCVCWWIRQARCSWSHYGGCSLGGQLCPACVKVCVVCGGPHAGVTSCCCNLRAHCGQSDRASCPMRSFDILRLSNQSQRGGRCLHYVMHKQLVVGKRAEEM